METPHPPPLLHGPARAMLPHGVLQGENRTQAASDSKGAGGERQRQEGVGAGEVMEESRD